MLHTDLLPLSEASDIVRSEDLNPLSSALILTLILTLILFSLVKVMWTIM